MTKEIERFGDSVILKLDVDGFEMLSLKNKKLAYHLSKAGLLGRNIYYIQNYKYNLNVKNTLELIYKNLNKNKFEGIDESLKNNFILYLKDFWLNVGIYDGFSSKKLNVPFSKNEFNRLVEKSGIDSNLSDLEITVGVLFDDKMTKQLRSIQENKTDVIAESGGNLYQNLTTDEVDFFRSVKYEKIHNSPKFGFNSLLNKKQVEVNSKEYNEYKEILLKKLDNIKDNQIEINLKKQIEKELLRLKENKDNIEIIVEDIISEKGLYGSYIGNIIFELKNAMKYAENVEQQNSISSLIKFYESGKPEDFDNHSLNWIKDKNSEVFFINGLIESYQDPKGVACTFESIVAFKNPEKTAKVNKIIKNIQWFEDNMPVLDIFKKEKATGLSASAVSVVGMAGATSPSLPLGICLPNSEWIREQYGSKSVNLLNVHNARGDNNELLEEFFLEEYLPIIKKYSSEAKSLHTDLHEVAGHGSCKTLNGVKNEDLDIFYSVIEESRADLVGLFFIPCPELQEMGIIDADVNLEEFSMAQYVEYLTNGLMLQLRRVEVGNNLSQPHFRNRQLISKLALHKSIESNAIEIVNINNKHFVKINNFKTLRKIFGDILMLIQDIKSRGNYKGAKDLVEMFGTLVDLPLHIEVVERVEKLNMPKKIGFLTPIIEEVKDENNNVIDFEIKNKESFIEDQLFLSKYYS